MPKGPSLWCILRSRPSWPLALSARRRVRPPSLQPRRRVRCGKGLLAGAPLTKDDESTKTPGVFLVGLTVRHGELSFCFIYKFRQRFGIVANAICKGLGRDTEAAVENCKNMNMYMDDFQCCKSTCGEAC